LNGGGNAVKLSQTSKKANYKSGGGGGDHEKSRAKKNREIAPHLRGKAKRSQREGGLEAGGGANLKNTVEELSKDGDRVGHQIQILREEKGQGSTSL